QIIAAVLPALAPLMPPLPPGVTPPRPGALAEPGALAGLMEQAGLRIAEQGEVACPFISPDAETAWRASASAGVNQRAIRQSGEQAVRAALATADRAHMRADGSIRYDNVFIWA